MDIQTASHLSKGTTVNETHTCPDISWDGCSAGRTNLTQPVETLRIYHAYNLWNIHMQRAWNCKSIGNPCSFVKLICTCVFAFLIFHNNKLHKKKEVTSSPVFERSGTACSSSVNEVHQDHKALRILYSIPENPRYPNLKYPTKTHWKHPGSKVFKTDGVQKSNMNVLG